MKEGEGKEDTICELKKIEPLVLPTQYSSDESESDLEGYEKEEDLMNHPDLLSPKLTMCSFLDRGGSGCDSDKMEPSLKESMYLINGSGSEIQLEGVSEIQSKSVKVLGMIIDNDDCKSSTLELGCVFAHPVVHVVLKMWCRLRRIGLRSDGPKGCFMERMDT